MRVVADEFEVLEFEIVDVADGGIDFHPRKRARLTGELKLGLLDVILIQVQIAEGVDEGARLEITHLRHHHGEERIGGDVEGNTKEQIGTALVKLAAQLAILNEELKERVAWWQSHLVDFAGIPGGDDVTAAVGIFANLFDDAINLIQRPSVGGAPVAPLCAVNTAEIAVGVGPFIPDGDAAFVEIFDIGVAFEEPEQLVNDGFEMQFLGGENRKSVGEWKPGLGAENREGAGAGAVGLEPALFEDETEELVVLDNAATVPTIRLHAGKRE